MISIGIDPGRNWGWAVFPEDTNAFLKSTHFPKPFSSRFESLQSFYKTLNEIFKEWNPDIVVTCRAMGRFAGVIRVHGAMAGVVELVCEQRGVTYMDIEDSTMRKKVLGNGRLKKDDVMNATGINDEHVADAMVAARYGLLLLEDGQKGN